jgi:ParB family chromosome partitioning protein
MNEFEAKEEVINNVIQVSIEKISLNPYQPRKTFESVAISELAQSIRQFGIIQPITVRKNCIGGFELISGERRLKAAKIAGLKAVPCIVIDANENDSAVIALLENLQRADLSFLEEADALSHLVQEHQYTQEQLAFKLGKSQSAIANKIRLLRLSPNVRKVITDNNLTERHARAILRINDENLQLKLLKTVCDNSYNVVQTDELVDRTIEKINGEHNKFHGKIKGVVQLRLFVNTLNKAVDAIKKSGLNVETIKNEKDDFIEYLIKIPKKREEINI